MRVPDRSRSNVVIVGSSRYDDPELRELPGVRNNVRDLRALLTDRRHGIVPAERCETVLDPVGTRDVYRTLREHADAAADTLVMYFAGHGLLSEYESLYLSMRDTSRTDLAVSALSFDHVREVLHSSPANNKVVILDCCYSGRAVEGMGPGDAPDADALFTQGSYVLTATNANREAKAPEGRTHTAFTGELIRLLRDGVREGPEMLSVHFLFSRLKLALRSQNFPEPANRMTGTAEGIVLSRNRWRAPEPRPATTTSATSAPARSAPAKTAPVVVRKPVQEPQPKTRTKTTPGYVHLPRLLFCHNGATLVGSGRDRLIRVWDVAARRVRHTLNGHSEPVAHFAVGANGTMLATTARDRTIRVWNPHDGRQLATFDAVSRWLAFHPVEPLLAGITGGGEPAVEIWDARTGRRIRVLRGHTQEILRVSFSPDGTRVLTTGGDVTLRVWDTRTGAQRIVLNGAHSPRQVAFHIGAGWLATTLASGTVRLRSLTTGEKIADLPFAGRPVELLAHRDGRSLATLAADGRVTVHDIRTRRPLTEIPADPSEPATRILFGPGQSIATLTDTGVTRLRDVRTGKVRHTLRDDCRAPHWLTFAPDGVHAVMGRRDQSVHLYDLRSGGPPHRLRPAAPAVPAQQKPKPRASTPSDTKAWADALLKSAYERLRLDVRDR